MSLKCIFIRELSKILRGLQQPGVFNVYGPKERQGNTQKNFGKLQNIQKNSEKHEKKGKKSFPKGVGVQMVSSKLSSPMGIILGTINLGSGKTVAN